MKIIQIYKFNCLLLILLCFVELCAQDRVHKLNEKFMVGNDVTLHLNTSHTAIIFETWNKNTVEIEAFVEADNINEENRERFLENWKVEAIGNSKEIRINAVTGNFWKGTIAKSTSRNHLDSNREFKILVPMIADMLSPLMENIENNPMPSALAENLASLNFDDKKYRENEEKYIQQWGDQIKEKFGDNSVDVIKKWTKELNGVTTGLQIESNGDWQGGDFARKMQAWASQFSDGVQNIEIVQGQGANVMVYRYSSTMTRSRNKVDRIIKVRMPITSNLRLNVRHGDIQLPEKVYNIVASLSHTKLVANKISGDQTYIRSSYAPIQVNQWNNGQLVVNYVKNCRIQRAKDLKINADSSNIFVKELDGNGAIGGSFATISIAELSNDFRALDLVIENSDFKLKLPDQAFNISYSGTQSRVSIPKKIETSVRRNFGNVFVNGFSKTRNTDKLITINAKYSDIVLE